MNFIIYDLEATCWEDWDNFNKTREIIEIGAIKVDEYGEIVGQFSKFIRPVLHPTLSVYCKRLTTITQEQVNRAQYFEEVCEEFVEWIGVNDGEDYLLCSWGYFDRKALVQDCQLHELDYDWTDEHISLKHQYQEIRQLPKPAGLAKAIEKEGFDWEGMQHRGIDDAFNLTKIFIKFQENWKY